VDIGALLSLAASGLLVGFVSGLVGIGGGVLIVPLLYFFYGHPGWSGVALAPELHAVVAHATSLFVIVPTSILGTVTYHRAGVIEWRPVIPMGVVAAGAAVVATRIAPHLPAEALKLGFGTLLLASGIQLLRPRRVDDRPGPGVAERLRGNLWVAAAGGVLVGGLASLLGVGGGIVAIPILLYVLGLGLDKVAATSMAIIVFTATAAVIGYALPALAPVGMPPGSVGYIHYAAGVPILVGSLVAVRTGAKVNLWLPTRALRILFGTFFLLLGLRLAVENLSALPGVG
jgi:uncharacterized protein